MRPGEAPQQGLVFSCDVKTEREATVSSLWESPGPRPRSARAQRAAADGNRGEAQDVGGKGAAQNRPRLLS